MKHLYKFVAVVLVVGLAGCATPLEGIYAPIDASGWKVAYAKDVPGKGNIVERIPSGESLNNWSKMVTIQFMEGEQRTPSVFMDGLKGQMTQRCPKVEWAVVESSNTSILYEWTIKNCPGQQDQHEVSRLLRGNDGLHRIAYVEKVSQLSKETRERWTANLKSAYLVKGGPNSPVVLKSN